MARPLMTPDELRRMDNSDCIIFEKGLKPIRAKKYWWFKKSNVVNDLTANEISHNDYKNEHRGEWRKVNPYKPYVDEKKEEDKELDIGSLDDLFDELDKSYDDEKNKKVQDTVQQPMNQPMRPNQMQRPMSQPMRPNPMQRPMSQSNGTKSNAETNGSTNCTKSNAETNWCSNDDESKCKSC